MSHLKQRRRLPKAVCSHALSAGCPRAPAARAGIPRPRSQWLRFSCVLACRCAQRFGALLMWLGAAGIAGFCIAALGFAIGRLSEAQYLASVAGSLCAVASSVLIARLGDPYELQRSECQRASAAVRRVTMSVARAISTSVSRSAMN